MIFHILCLHCTCGSGRSWSWCVFETVSLVPISKNNIVFFTLPPPHRVVSRVIPYPSNATLNLTKILKMVRCVWLWKGLELLPLLNWTAIVPSAVWRRRKPRRTLPTNGRLPHVVPVFPQQTPHQLCAAWPPPLFACSLLSAELPDWWTNSRTTSAPHLGHWCRTF